LNALEKVKKRIHKQIEATDNQVVFEKREEAQEEMESALFRPYRAFGYYTSTVPACVYKSGEDTLIASVVGKHAFYVYNTTKLGLVFMSRFISEEITGIKAA
jgi:aspartyl/asparaginyl beta-hydroxylase (cupin superfamily)